MNRSIWIGYDMREAAAFAVAMRSARKYAPKGCPVRGVLLDELKQRGLYKRPMGGYSGRGQPALMFDDLSGAPMSTAFAISRFFVPMLAGCRGLALFMDCDMLVRDDLTKLFDQYDPSKAVMVVKHDYNPPEGLKMDGQRQLPYPRKNWSSVTLWNCAHPANGRLSLEHLNGAPGRDLHAFDWLRDDEIGELDVTWNWIVGHSPEDVDPSIVHFSEGGPWFPGYESVPYADEWFDALAETVI